MKAFIFLLAISAWGQSTTVNQGVTNLGIVDSSHARATTACRQGTGSPNGRDNGTLMECYDQTDATPGSNTWKVTVAGSPATWTLQGTANTGSAQSVFASSSAAVVTSSATPAFSFADITGPKSRIRYEFTPTVNVTGPTFTNLSAGATIYIAIKTDGVHTFTWNSTIADGICQPDTDNAVLTTATIQVGADGSTLHGIGCVGAATGTVSKGSFGTAASVNPQAGGIDCRTVATGMDCLLPSGVHSVTVPSTAVTHTVNIPIAGAPITTGTASVGIPNPPVQFACPTGIINAAIAGNASGSMTVDIWKASNVVPNSGNKISASAPLTLSSAQFGTSTLSGWTLTIAAGDVFWASVATADGVLTSANITLTCQ